MYARSTTVSGDPRAIDEVIAFVRDEVMPTALHLEGCLGISMLVERQIGECIVTTSWRSEDTMRTSGTTMMPMRLHAASLMGGEAEVEAWEAAVMHREHAAPEGACCRVTWMRMHAGEIDRGIDIYRHALMPEIQAIDGFVSASLLVNRPASRACSTVTYDSHEAMAASRDRAWAIRDAGVREAGVDVLDVVEYDLVLAHLHLPELV